MIYTACPECQTVFPITIQQLRETRAISHCDVCDIQFDALELLSDTLADSEIEDIDSQLNKQADILGFKYNPEIDEHHGPLPWEEQNSNQNLKYWLSAGLLGVLILICQVFYFEFDHLAQSTSARPWLNKVCSILFCTVPTYKNTNKIKVLKGSLQPISDTAYQLETVFTNYALFPQPYPKIKLTLLKLNGSELASRIFEVPVYFPGHSETKLMAVDETVQFSLDIVKPTTAIGGYTIELI